MTQSGQGEEPPPRQAREGIVLPSDGGEPLLPGMTGGPDGPQYGRPVPPTPASAPPEGQAWGTPWGPDQHQPPPSPPGQGWVSGPAEPWGSQDPYQQPAPAAWGTQDPANAIPPQPQPTQGAAYGGEAQPGSGAHPTYAPQEPGPQPSYPSQAYAPQEPAPQPSYGVQEPAPRSSYPSQVPGAQPSFASPPPTAESAYAPNGQSPTGGHGALPPAAGYGPPADAYGTPAPGAYGAGAPLPPAGPGTFGAPLPPADEGATQYIPPVGGGGAQVSPDGATQFIPPVPAAASGPDSADEGATQFIPPVGPGALPPEVPAEASGDATRYLGRMQQNPGPLPPANPDAEATQYIPPVTTGQDRQPPAEFDSLFRTERGAEGPAGATQQMPRFEPPQAHAHAQPAYAPPAADDRRGRGGRTGSRVPLIAAIGVGIAVLGVGAGALLASGGDDQGDDNNQTVSATAPATEGSPSPSVDAAKQQAIALDKLLADSGDSRTTVINAVAHVKSCDKLGQAAADLRDAAGQRTGLVASLAKLSVDKLPNHAALTTALNSAWKASASADNHYAAWADQVAKNKKGCPKGQARTTGQTAAGNTASGTASTQKAKAAQLWNAIAKTYGLTQRQPTQL
ncbi:hypothetical protein ACIHFB_32685 [Streptomyces sp. NPDC051963]|uniref:hypothetical protein n=1 Tax=Streptomyces sp. NPDC051963 TaxID=3365678 RepID=UPI0037CFE84E